MKNFKYTNEVQFPDLLEYLDENKPLDTVKLDRLIMMTTAKVDKDCCIQYYGIDENLVFNHINAKFLDKKITSQRSYFFGYIQIKRIKTLRQIIDLVSPSFISFAKMQEYYFTPLD